MNTKNNALLGILDMVVKIGFVVVVFVVIIKGSKLAYNYGYQIFNQKPVSSGEGRTVTITIDKGDGAKAIGAKLAESGLITDKNLFLLQERFSEYHGMAKSGTYELSTNMTPEEMLAIMAGGSESDSEEAGEGAKEQSEDSNDQGGDEGGSEGEEKGDSESAEDTEGDTESAEDTEGESESAETPEGE